MLAARSTTPHDVVVVQLPDPVPGRGEIVCRVLACGVCGSDVSDAYVARKLPGVLGHEVVGEVLETGTGVDAVQPGDRVIVHHHAPCGSCRRCRRGHETLCEQFRATAIDPGGFAEQILVEAALVAELLALGDLDPLAGTFVEPLACVLRALDRARLTASDALLVVGAGSNGLLAIAAARARGVVDVMVREPRAERRRLAEAWGATADSGEPADVAFLTTADEQAIADGAAALGPGGTLCLYATTKPGASLGLDAEQLFLREITVCSSWSAGPADMRAAYDLIVSGRIDPLALVTHRLGLAETARALDLQRRGEAIKAVVVP
ncbi:MAG: alcohol dehydrogenase catalytic domain-containing protein [Solirubrobacteraceae bacterium]|nr:alcohol dehydrogenase catalytic domain-containing protein [Solirubrobacteraceae bacterium]